MGNTWVDRPSEWSHGEQALDSIILSYTHENYSKVDLHELITRNEKRLL